MKFTPKTPVKELHAEHILDKPQDMDWETIYQAHGWDVPTWSADKCDRCGKLLVSSEPHEGGIHHADLVWNEDETDCEGYVSFSAPMMSYAYPISIRYGTTIEDCARAIARLPLVIVELDGDEYLALSGGGMDLSWEICEGYMRMGYLPPVHFAKLPEYAGMKLDARHRWVLAGMRRSLLLARRWINYDLSRLAQTRAAIQEGI